MTDTSLMTRGALPPFRLVHMHHKPQPTHLRTGNPPFGEPVKPCIPFGASPKGPRPAPPSKPRPQPGPSRRPKILLSGPRQKPGESPHKPGEYIERGKRGGKVKNPRQVTIEPRDPKLPPTQEPGRTWERIGPPKP